MVQSVVQVAVVVAVVVFNRRGGPCVRPSMIPSVCIHLITPIRLYKMMNDQATLSTLEKPSIPVADARGYIEALDLDYIIQSMCAPSYTLPRWNISDATHCCRLYKNYLILLKKHLPEFLVPTREIDEFWHNHILYTKNYCRDSQAIFGHYLHHEPASPDDNTDHLVNGFMKTKAYYLAEFGQPLFVLHRTS